MRETLRRLLARLPLPLLGRPRGRGVKPPAWNVRDMIENDTGARTVWYTTSASHVYEDDENWPPGLRLEGHADNNADEPYG
jgi:hypothetical protein